jgi:hypothetical protein
LKDRLSELSCAGEDMLIMDGLTLFGLLAVTAMLVFYAMEDHNPMYILAFAGACALASLYGILQGAWPFGVIEAIWAGVALHRWRRKSN